MGETSRMLESKLAHFTSFQDISYFLGTSDANTPQRISKDFVLYYKRLLQRAIHERQIDNVMILAQVINYLLDQNHQNSIQILMSCALHYEFESMLNFALEHVSRKPTESKQGDALFHTILNIIMDYCKLMNDHYIWLFENMLPIFMGIISDKEIFHFIRTQTIESILGIFNTEDRDVVTFLRKSVNKDHDKFDVLCEKAVKTLTRTGDFRLQESIVELLFRMWPTDARKKKITNWFPDQQNILNKFRNISYDNFDYGVRSFLNEVNAACSRRRVVTLQYKELLVGNQTLVPSNRWCNCVDFCYESKILDIRFPSDNMGGTQACNWNMDHIKGSQLKSFHVTENMTSSQTIDLRLEFISPTIKILESFPLEDPSARNLIIKFYRIPRLDGKLLTKFSNILFGKRIAEASQRNRKGSKIKSPMLFGNRDILPTQSEYESAMNTSYVSLAQGSQNSQQPQSQSVKQSSARGTFIPASEADLRTLSVSLLEKLTESANEGPFTATTSKACYHYARNAKTLNDVATDISSGRSRNQSRTHSPVKLPVTSGRVSQRMESARLSGAYRRSSQAEKISVHPNHYDHKPSQNDGNPSSSRIIRNRAAKARFIPQKTPHTSQHSQTVKPSMITKESPITRVEVLVNSSEDFAPGKVMRHSSKNDDSSKRNTGVSSESGPNSSKNAAASKHRSKAKKKDSIPLRNIIPESQTAFDVSNQALFIDTSIEPANVSTDLVPDCTNRDHFEELPLEEDITSGQPSKSVVSPISIQMPRPLTRSQIRRNNKINLDEKIEDCIEEAVARNELTTAQESKSVKKKKTKLSAAARVNSEFQPLDGLSSNSERPRHKDPVMRSVKKKPIAATYIKSPRHSKQKNRKKTESDGPRTTGTTSEDQSERQHSCKRRGSALKSLNIDPRPGGLEKSRPVKILKKKGKTRKKRDLPLPFEEFEEMPNISDTEPIETVRDASAHIQMFSLIPSPEEVLVQRRSSREEKSETSDRSKGSSKRRPRVSFEAGLLENTSATSGNGGTRKRTMSSRKSRLFDSTSSAADSVASSELSWIKESKAKLMSAAPVKTFKGKRNKYFTREETSKSKEKRNKPLGLPPLDDNTKEQAEPVSTFLSHSSSEIVRSEVANKSVTKLQNLATLCNMTFDDIAGDCDKILLQDNFEKVEGLIDLTIAAPDLTLETKISPLKAETSLTIENWSDAACETSLVNLSLLPAVRTNNQTPVDTGERTTLKEKIRPEKRKATISPVSERSIEDTYFQSKKKLRLSSPSLQLNSACQKTFDHSLSMKMVKLVGSYMRRINKNINHGDVRRNDHIKMFESRAARCEQSHVTLMKELHSLENEATTFVNSFNGKIKAVMNKAANNTVKAQEMHSDLVKNLAQSNVQQSTAMEELRQEISKELRALISKS